nr:MAG TPA: hypothetical protein [Caudoviricetes sp.]
MPCPFVYPSGLPAQPRGLLPQAEPFRQPLYPLATSFVERQAPGLVHIVHHVNLANSEYADLIYQDGIFSLGRRCQTVAGQACLDLSPDTALLKILPVTESFADLLGMSGHVVLDHGFNDGAGITKRPTPFVITTTAFHRDSQVSGNGHENGFKDSHFLNLFASIGIGGRIDLPAHGLNGLLSVDLSFTEVKHIGRRSSQNILAKSIVSHCVNPLSNAFRFPRWIS